MNAFQQNFARHWVWIFIISYVAKWVYLFHGIDFSSPFPIVNFDYIQYYARVLRIIEFLKHGHVWGYDPFEMAGYPAVLRELGTFPLALISAALSPLVAVKTTVLWLEILGNVFMPLLILPAIRNFGGRRENLQVGFALLVTFYGGIETLAQTTLTQGLFGFNLGCFVAIWHVSLLWQWLEQRNWSSWFWLTFASVILPQFHPSAVVVVVVPALILVSMRSIAVRDVALLELAMGISVLFNWYWIAPYLAYSQWIDILKYWSSGWVWFVEIVSPVQPTWFEFSIALGHLALIGTFISAMVILFRTSRIRAVTFSGWVLWLSLILFVGSSVPFIKTLQPLRFQTVFWIVMVLGVAVTFDWRRVRNHSVVGSFLLLLLAAGWVLTYKSDRSALYITRLEPQQKQFLDYVQNQSVLSGRLMVECSYRSKPNIADIVAVLSKKPLLGGHDPGNFLTGRFTMFGGFGQPQFPWVDASQTEAPFAFGRPLYSFRMEESRFSSYLRQYNVQQIAAWSLATVRILNTFERTLTVAGKQGEYTLYDVRLSSPSWFVRGSGNVAMDYDRLTISQASPGTLLLKFHWIKSLKTEPPLPLTPVFVGKDPVPFIQINNNQAVSDILVYNAGL